VDEAFDPQLIDRLKSGDERAFDVVYGAYRHRLFAYREVLLLVGVQGMTPSEAAAVCELTPEAMRQRLLRARRMLAWWLNARDGAKMNEGRHGGQRTR
jgi:DNA-directed RNA polymerase specialized sigma24 family protein